MKFEVKKHLNHTSPENLDEMLRLYIEQWHINNMFEVASQWHRIDLKDNIWDLIGLMDPEYKTRYMVSVEFNPTICMFEVVVQTPSKLLEYTGKY